jgi:hypothetical protein
MTKLKARPEAARRADYEADFFAWTQQQAQLLRAPRPGSTGTILPRRSIAWAGATGAGWRAGFAAFSIIC